MLYNPIYKEKENNLIISIEPLGKWFEEMIPKLT